METITEVPKRKGGRKKGSFKPPERRRVRINFSLSPEVIRELEERVAAGERSIFVEQSIREKLDQQKN